MMAAELDESAVLEFLGATPDDPSALVLLRGMSVALMSERYRAQLSTRVPEVTAETLTALVAIGKTWLKRELISRLFVDSWYLAGTQLEERADELWRTLARSVSDSPQFLALTRLSEQDHPAVASQVSMQVVGLLVYLGEEARAWHIVADTVDRVLASRRNTVYLSRSFNLLLPERDRASAWDSASRTFVFDDRRGRSASAKGSDRGAARERAAAVFVDRYGQRNVSSEWPDRFELPGLLEGVPTGWRSARLRMTDGFDLPSEWSGLIDQAFVHTTRPNHHRGTGGVGVSDNSQLATVGYAVLRHEHAFAGASGLLSGKISVLPEWPGTPALIRAATELGVGPLLQIGRRGPSRSGEAAARGFVALAGAIHLAKRSSGSAGLRPLPMRWEPIRGTFVGPDSGTFGVGTGSDLAAALDGSVAAVRSLYEAAGYRVETGSGTASYGLDVRCGDEHLQVKVSSTVWDTWTSNQMGVDEVRHYHEWYPNTVLAVVHPASPPRVDLTFPWLPEMPPG